MSIFRDEARIPSAIEQINNLTRRICVDLDDLCLMVRELPEDIVPITEENLAFDPRLEHQSNPVALALAPLHATSRQVGEAYEAWQAVRRAVLDHERNIAYARKMRAGTGGLT